MADQSLKKQTPSRNYGSTQVNMEGDVGFAAGPSTGVGFDPILFDRLCSGITTDIFDISKHAATLEKTLKTIGTRNDTDALRDSVHTVATTAKKSTEETTKKLKRLTIMTQGHDVINNKQIKMKVTRLTSDFEAALHRFSDTQKQVVTKMKSCQPARSSFQDSEEDKSSLTESDMAQQQAQMQQIEFENELLVERERRITQIEADVVQVNDIMTELAKLVSEQKATVDSIEGNIEEGYNQVETGRAELQKAENYQSKYRKRLFCLLGTGLVILIVVIIILVTSLKK